MKRKLAGIFLTAVLLSGCAAKVPATGTTPAVKGTPQEQALAYNATIASANNTIAKTVIDATGTTPALIDVPTANRILIVQSKIADTDRQLTPLLGDAANISANSAQIRKLAGDIRTAANSLIQSGDLGIKDAKTKAAITTAINTVLAGADEVILSLISGGLLK